MNQTSLLFQVLKQVHFNLEKRLGEYIYSVGHSTAPLLMSSMIS